MHFLFFFRNYLIDNIQILKFKPFGCCQPNVPSQPCAKAISLGKKETQTGMNLIILEANTCFFKNMEKAIHRW